MNAGTIHIYDTRMFPLSVGPNIRCEHKERLPKTTHKDAKQKKWIDHCLLIGADLACR